MTPDFSSASWLHPPERYTVTDQSVTITTQPQTDFWQRTYYGFRNDNAPALLIERRDNFTLTVRASFAYRQRFDQCGLIIHLDSDHWFKASVEYENANYSRLGSVVTNGGHSDWATTDIATPVVMWYRLSRRGPDFLIESSSDGVAFQQMRIFHLHALGPTTPDTARRDPPPPPNQPVRFGLYACSPLDSSFDAHFDRFTLEESNWRAHRSV